MKTTFSVLSGILFLLAFLPYIRAILRGETKPAKASWIIWMTADLVVLFGMLAEKTLNGSLVGAVCGVSVVVLLALRHGTPGWSRLDVSCMALALFGIVLWKIFQSPVLAIATSCLVLVIGAIPTWVSAWKDPSRENKLAWFLFWVGSVFGMLAIPNWLPASTLQPSTFFLIETISVGVIFLRSYFVKSSMVKTE